MQVRLSKRISRTVSLAVVLASLGACVEAHAQGGPPAHRPLDTSKPREQAWQNAMIDAQTLLFEYDPSLSNGFPSQGVDIEVHSQGPPGGSETAGNPGTVSVNFSLLESMSDSYAQFVGLIMITLWHEYTHFNIDLGSGPCSIACEELTVQWRTLQVLCGWIENNHAGYSTHFRATLTAAKPGLCNWHEFNSDLWNQHNVNQPGPDLPQALADCLDGGNCSPGTPDPRVDEAPDCPYCSD